MAALASRIVVGGALAAMVIASVTDEAIPGVRRARAHGPVGNRIELIAAD